MVVSSSSVASRDSEMDEEGDESAGIEEEEEVSTGLLAAELMALSKAFSALGPGECAGA